MCRHQRMIDLAIHTATLSEHPRFRLGTVITRGSCIISLGTNRLRTHPKQNNPHTGKKSVSIHAELDAILKIRGDLSGCRIYVARITKRGVVALAKPCASCQILLDEVGIRQIYFTTANGEFEKLRERKNK